METIKHSLKQGETSNQGIANNDVNGTGTTSCESVAPSMHGAPDPASAGRHQAMDQTKQRMKYEDSHWVLDKEGAHKKKI